MEELAGDDVRPRGAGLCATWCAAVTAMTPEDATAARAGWDRRTAGGRRSPSSPLDVHAVHALTSRREDLAFRVGTAGSTASRSGRRGAAGTRLSATGLRARRSRRARFPSLRRPR